MATSKKKPVRKPLTKMQAAKAGRKAAKIRKEEGLSKAQAFAIAASKVRKPTKRKK